MNPRRSRIMQFAGQRTDLNLKPVGKPYNILIKLADDILPDPDAVLITGITPQQTLAEGITETEFTKLFYEEIVKPETCFVGFNNIRFDDEFMRYLLYRNFRDPYAWQWKDGNSRWDILDVTRMTRALRPGGIEWPFDENGVCTNKLELMTKLNGLDHDKAHDALNDVLATIAVAKLIKDKQQKLFDYLFSIRNKQKVTKIVVGGQPFVYSTGRYPNEYLKTSVAINLGMHPTSQGALVYDLRYDPEPYLKMDVEELVEEWKYKPDREGIALPVKSLQFNRAPAVAPLGVLDKDSSERIQIDLDKIQMHAKKLRQDPAFYKRISDAVDKMNIERDKRIALNLTPDARPASVDEQLYDNFISNTDRNTSDKLAAAKPADVSDYADKFKDVRLKTLVPLYKARNFPNYLTNEEREEWERHREKMLLSGGAGGWLAGFSTRLNELSETVKDENKRFLLEELRLYAESIIPEPA